MHSDLIEEIEHTRELFPHTTKKNLSVTERDLQCIGLSRNSTNRQGLKSIDFIFKNVWYI